MKVKGWKKIFHANGNQKKAGVAILISDKTDVKVYTQHRSTKQYKAAAKRDKKRREEKNTKAQTLKK